MNNQFTEITTNSWGSRILKSIKGVLVGFLMFLASFGVLYWNEGRVDVSKIAETATEIPTNTQVSNELDNQLVSLTGTLKSDEKLGDTYIKKGDYLSLQRSVQMYAWRENKSTNSQRNTGGSETTETTYDYVQEWTSMPQDSSNFKYPEGHQNPELTVQNSYATVSTASIGSYSLQMNQLDLSFESTLNLNNSNVNSVNGVSLANEKYLFKGNGSLDTPQIGDIRIMYKAINNPVNTSTVFGTLDIQNQLISPFYGQKNTKLYRAFDGSREGAISTMSSEYKTTTWLIRLGGFLLMWFGLLGMLQPISVFLDVLPIFGSISRVGLGLTAFIVALVLSIVTIIISIVFHNLIILTLVILGLIGWFSFMYKKKNSSASIPAPPSIK